MKIYTKTGDQGETSTFLGKRISKSSPIIKANGQIDELNSSIGVLVSVLEFGKLKSKLIRVQSELLELGADVSLGNPRGKINPFRVKSDDIKRLEEEIDEWDHDLEKLKNFILPGGSFEGSLAHLARSICRRAERELVTLSLTNPINTEALKYLNRLSDWLFTLARYINKLKNAGETKFISRKRA